MDSSLSASCRSTATTTQPFTSPFQTPAPASSYTFPPIPAVAEPCSAETEAPSARSPTNTSTTPYYSRWADPDYVPFPPTNPMRLLKSPPSSLGAPPLPRSGSAAIPIRHPETLNQQALSGTFRSSSSRASASGGGGVLAVAALAAAASQVGRELHAPTPPPPPSPASPIGSSETEGEMQGQCARCAALGQRSEEVEQQLEAVQRIVSVEDERNELRERLEEVRAMFGGVEKAREEVLSRGEGEGERTGALGVEVEVGGEDKWGAHGTGSGLEEEVMIEGMSVDAGWRIESEAAVKMRAEVEELKREKEALIARVESLDRRILGGGGRGYSRDELLKLRFVGNVQPDLRNAPREMVDPNFRRKSPPHPAIPRYGPELPPQAVAYRRPPDEMQRAVQKERELFKESWDEEMEKPGSWEEDEGTLYKRVLDRVKEGMRLWREEQSGEEDEEEEPTSSSPSPPPPSATSPPCSTALDYWTSDAEDSALSPDVERTTPPTSPAQLSPSPPPPLAATSAFLPPSRRGSCDLPSLEMVFDDGWGELGDAPVYSRNGDARFGGGGRRRSASRRSLSSGGESLNSGMSGEGSDVGQGELIVSAGGLAASWARGKVNR